MGVEGGEGCGFGGGRHGLIFFGLGDWDWVVGVVGIEFG